MFLNRPLLHLFLNPKYRTSPLQTTMTPEQHTELPGSGWDWYAGPANPITLPEEQVTEVGGVVPISTADIRAYLAHYHDITQNLHNVNDILWGARVALLHVKTALSYVLQHDLAAEHVAQMLTDQVQLPEPTESEAQVEEKLTKAQRLAFDALAQRLTSLQETIAGLLEDELATYSTYPLGRCWPKISAFGTLREVRNANAHSYLVARRHYYFSGDEMFKLIRELPSWRAELESMVLVFESYVPEVEANSNMTIPNGVRVGYGPSAIWSQSVTVMADWRDQAAETETQSAEHQEEATDVRPQTADDHAGCGVHVVEQKGGEGEDEEEAAEEMPQSGWKDRLFALAMKRPWFQRRAVSLCDFLWAHVHHLYEEGGNDGYGEAV
ncbi:hypothetical protein BU16DRAFT_539414 [Lophium mytilinum]|uniref:Uncharacterized protein n=1 Tax=Lophium mytilinum TaxID=390894 RepID=A0A6A6QSG9_9PEZI|nr:hypothetical protein BU16DRAFT_539414 [Lophium mytilinum]